MRFSDVFVVQGVSAPQINGRFALSRYYITLDADITLIFVISLILIFF